MIGDWGEKLFYECVACLCLRFATLLPGVADFMAIGFTMGMMTVWFALPFDSFKFVWESENGYFTTALV